MARDVTGASRANMFETVTASDGTRYTPIGGSAAKIRYAGSDGSVIEAPNRRMTGDDLQWYDAARQSMYATAGVPSRLR